MTKKNFLFYFLIATMFVVTSCKSCKNKFSKTETPAADASSTLDTSMYAGLSDTSSKAANSSSTSASSAQSSTNNNSSTANSTASSASASSNDVMTTSSTGKKMANAVENESAAKYGHHSGGVSRSIYDGINDQQERYVVRKAEGYNDAYYIDDYNGTNKFYEDHYKKASTLEKPEAEYIDHSINLPSASYAKGPTQKSVDAQNPAPVVEEPKAKAPPVGTSTGTIGVTKKTADKK